MAIYFNDRDVRQDPDGGFHCTETWNAGDRPMLAGVYKCGCGAEWPLRDDEALPGAEHRHQASQGRALWRLIIIAEAPRVVAMPKQVRLKPALRRSEAYDGRVF